MSATRGNRIEANRIQWNVLPKNEQHTQKHGLYTTGGDHFSRFEKTLTELSFPCYMAKFVWYMHTNSA